ncbi:MAG TPA: M56 family metallopeptidase, partial [Planctomycetota bacterium]|nr:M56 family metallopeptidase [Planctomycetota bacterium]
MDSFVVVSLENAMVAAVLGAAVFCASLVRRRAALFHVLWVIVLLKLVTPPLVTLPVPWPVSGEHADRRSEDALPGRLDEARDTLSTIAPPLVAATEEPAPAGPPASRAKPAAGTSAASLGTILLSAWAAGALLYFAMAAARTLQFRRVLRGARPAPADIQREVKRIALRLEIRRPPAVSILSRPMPPVLWGLGRASRIVLSEGLWAALEDPQRRALLAHELAHFRRGDSWVRWLEVIVTGLYWWHPVVWLARREIRSCEEECCDAWALWAVPLTERAYGETLLRVTDFLSGIRAARPILGSGMGAASAIRRRLRTILGGGGPRRLSVRGRIAACAVALLVLPFLPAVARPAAKTAEQKPAPPSREGAILAALDWLQRHQSPDGGWKARDFTAQCEVTCRNADPARHGDGRGKSAHDAGVTGLAVLALARSGHTHMAGPRPELVECALKAAIHLLGLQVRSEDPTTDGRIGDDAGEQWIYNHAIATTALAELYLLSSDAGLREPVTRAVELCLHAQNDGRGWRYGIQPGDNDTSVMGWMVHALEAARAARLDIREEAIHRALAGARAWIGFATAANGKTGYFVPGDDGSMLAGIHPGPYPFSKELPCMTAVAIACRLAAGDSPGDAAIRKGADLLLAHPPLWQENAPGALSTVSFCYWYLGSLAVSRL